MTDDETIVLNAFAENCLREPLRIGKHSQSARFGYRGSRFMDSIIWIESFFYLNKDKFSKEELSLDDLDGIEALMDLLYSEEVKFSHRRNLSMMDATMSLSKATKLQRANIPYCPIESALETIGEDEIVKLYEEAQDLLD